jgi:hypothetical protein
VGGTVVASAGGGRRSELVILRVARGGITLRQRLRLGAARALRGGASGPFLSAPIFVGADRYLVARVTTLSANEHVSFTGFVTCDRSARRCWHGRNLLPATAWAAIIGNPSRPE